MINFGDSSKQNLTHGGDDGFSLVEALVGLALLALIAGIISSFFVQLLQVKHKEIMLEKKAIAQEVINYTADMFANALPLPLYTNDPAGRIFFFNGSATRIQFVSVANIDMLAKALRNVEIECLPNEKGEFSLVQRLYPRRFKKSSNFLTEITLLKDLKLCNFKFIQNNENIVGKGIYSTVFESARSLPYGITISVDFAANNAAELSSVRRLTMSTFD